MSLIAVLFPIISIGHMEQGVAFRQLFNKRGLRLFVQGLGFWVHGKGSRIGMFMVRGLRI